MCILAVDNTTNFTETAFYKLKTNPNNLDCSGLFLAGILASSPLFIIMQEKGLGKSLLETKCLKLLFLIYSPYLIYFRFLSHIYIQICKNSLSMLFRIRKYEINDGPVILLHRSPIYRGKRGGKL